MFFQQKKNNVYVQFRNNTNLGNFENSTNFKSFASNNRNQKLNGYYNPNNNIPITPKDLNSDHKSQEKAFNFIIFNNVINPSNGQYNNIDINMNNNMNHNPNNISNNNEHYFPKNQSNFKMDNIGQNNIGNNTNERYSNQQVINYNEINQNIQFNGGANGIQDKRSHENIIKEQSCALINPEGNLDNLKVPTDQILCKKNPQYYKQYYEKKTSEGSTDLMVENNILNNNNPNNNKYINYNILNGPTKDKLDKALNNENNSSEKFDNFTGNALKETLGFNINNNNGNTINNDYSSQLSFTVGKYQNNYYKVNNGNSNPKYNNINLMSNNNFHSRNNSSTKRSNRFNTGENYNINGAYDPRKRASSCENQKNEIFSKTFFMKGINNVGISGDQLVFKKFKNGMKINL
jgi:hypothetical protein